MNLNTKKAVFSPLIHKPHVKLYFANSNSTSPWPLICFIKQMNETKRNIITATSL